MAKQPENHPKNWPANPLAGQDWAKVLIVWAWQVGTEIQS